MTSRSKPPLAPPVVDQNAGSAVTEVRRERLENRALLSRVRDVVGRVVPADASVLAISRGDAGLLEIAGRRISHFPQNEHGVYAGFHPSDSTAAITHLEALRARGAEFLLIPATAYWWMKHYKDFRRHLESRYRAVSRDEDTCIVFSLADRAGLGEDVQSADQEGAQGYRALVGQVREVVEALLPADATSIVVSGGDEALLNLGTRKGWHFPQDDRGAYAGFYPADSLAAIDHLEVLRTKGGDYFVIPRTAFWWLTYYREFADHLAVRCRLVTRQAHVCAIYALKERPAR